MYGKSSNIAEWFVRTRTTAEWESYYSSASFYEMNEKHFDFLKDVREEF
ncbi:MAG: hypothetical protein H7254_18390 [Ferruginibacter sp.]|nr:hypothetical protein [Ferruginibacter sp.]